MTDKAPALVRIDGPEDESFPVTITVRNLKGVESSITFDCIPRTQTEWAAEGDRIREDVRARIEAEEAAAKKKPRGKSAAEAQPQQTLPRLEQMVAERINGDAGMALRVAKGWSLADKFTAASMAKLEDKFPGAVSDLHREYSRRVSGEREKN